MRSKYIFLGALLLFALLSPAQPVQAQQAQDTPLFIIYGSHSCGECERALEVLENEFGSNSIIFYDLSDAKNARYFDEIYSEVFPGKAQRIPLVGVFNGTLRAIVSGYHDADFWNSILKVENGTALYYLEDYMGKEQDADRIARYEGLFRQSIVIEEKKDIMALTGMVLLAALADSINPCAFAVLIAFLTLISYRKGREEVLRSGLAFILAVFIVYTLMGFGLITLFHSLPWLKLLVGFAGIILGAVEMVDSVRDRKESSVLPERLKERIKALIRGVSNPKGAFLIGIFVSLFLLPCTSGPYFIAMSLISGSAPLTGMALLLLYNIVFVLPFLLITIMIWASRMDTIQTKRWREKYGKYMSFVAGAIIMILGEYLVLEYAGII